MEVVFGSIVFDTDQEMIDSFFKTVANQDRDDFDVLLINDGLPKEKLDNILDKYESLRNRIIVVDADRDSTFYKNRCQLINEAKNRGYDLLVRGDFDDEFSSDRVSSFINQFDDGYGFFYNDIYLNGESIFKLLPTLCDDYKQIGQYNFVGEGACAINLHYINEALLDKLRRGKTNVFDWYMFTTFLLEGIKGKRIDSGYTFYRIYELNMAGVPLKNYKTITKELGVKRLHYSLLKDKNDYYKDLYEKYNNDANIKITNDIDKYYWWQFTYVDIDR